MKVIDLEKLNNFHLGTFSFEPQFSDKFYFPSRPLNFSLFTTKSSQSTSSSSFATASAAPGSFLQKKLTPFILFQVNLANSQEIIEKIEKCQINFVMFLLFSPTSLMSWVGLISCVVNSKNRSKIQLFLFISYALGLFFL